MSEDVHGTFKFDHSKLPELLYEPQPLIQMKGLKTWGSGLSSLDTYNPAVITEYFLAGPKRNNHSRHLFDYNNASDRARTISTINV
ncbi:hypothetical protein AMATHDRAFT_6326 [Amanita thiersii Skay4041]|uniref:Uncharacterized protein n=1 Tax=Amanita thiersii Skay4041 TaxID=703135 RepID=A0A2A9NHX0_9AGAR|nr:hypothetical protein AMATHDRAFT_6326 [Amanita thiersii Skay4041]